jgi:hypothetical protein
VLRHFSKRFSHTQIAAIALLAVGLIGITAGSKGVQLKLLILYNGPDELATWFAGQRASLIMVLFLTLTWLAPDLSKALLHASGSSSPGTL